MDAQKLLMAWLSDNGYDSEKLFNSIVIIDGLQPEPKEMYFYVDGLNVLITAYAIGKYGPALEAVINLSDPDSMDRILEKIQKWES